VERSAKVKLLIAGVNSKAIRKIRMRSANDTLVFIVHYPVAVHVFEVKISGLQRVGRCRRWCHGLIVLLAGYAQYLKPVKHTYRATFLCNMCNIRSFGTVG